MSQSQFLASLEIKKLTGVKQFGGDSNTHVVGKEHVKRAEELEELLGQLLVEGRPLPVLVGFHGTSFTVSEGYHCGSCFAEHERESECEVQLCVEYASASDRQKSFRSK